MISQYDQIINVQISTNMSLNKHHHHEQDLQSGDHLSLELDHLHVGHHSPILFVQYVQCLGEINTDYGDRKSYIAIKMTNLIPQ